MRPLALLLATLAPAVAAAHDPYALGYEGCDSAARSAQIADLETRLYLRYEAPSRERRLRSEIAFSEARAAALRERLIDYDRVNRFGTGNALGWSADHARLDLRREEVFRRDLQDQLLLEQRLRRRERLVHAAAVERATAARTRAAAVGDGSITIVNHGGGVTGLE